MVAKGHEDCFERAVEMDRALADEELLEAILKKGGNTKTAMTNAGPVEVEDSADDIFESDSFTGGESL